MILFWRKPKTYSLTERIHEATHFFNVREAVKMSKRLKIGDYDVILRGFGWVIITYKQNLLGVATYVKVDA